MSTTNGPSEGVSLNRANWNARVATHVASKFYDVPGFIETRQPRLDPVELEEMGDVTGKDLLHLQCHFGIDTLSWGLKGAHVTGLDFSSDALKVARDLATTMGVSAEFVEADVHTADLGRTFDIVYATGGVLCWIEDMFAWARTAARHVQPGGFVYLLDGHPVADIFNQDDPDATELTLDPRFTYFKSEADKGEWSGTYADPDATIVSPMTYQWMHPLSEIIQALRDAGLAIDFVHEFPLCFWQRFPFMTYDGTWWRIDGDPIPLIFSIKAYKPR